MAKLGDDLEKSVDESMPFLFEKLGDTSALIEHGCLTVAQCALLVPAILTFKKPGDASQMAADYVQLVLLDIAHGELSPKHPETLLPYSQYLRMAESGMYGADGDCMPVADAGWLVSLDEAKRWLKRKDISVNFDGLEAELTKMAASAGKGEAVPVTSPSGDDKPWLIAHPNDPEPDYPWYTPARYFARQLVKEDSTLLVKKTKLAKKIAASLSNVGIFKRGGKLPIADTTIIKALVKVTLS